MINNKKKPIKTVLFIIAQNKNAWLFSLSKEFPPQCSCISKLELQHLVEIIKYPCFLGLLFLKT